MALYPLTVTTSALGLGVMANVRVRAEKRRVSIADTYPPVNTLIYLEQATNGSGVVVFQLEPDDLTTYSIIKIYDAAGILVYQKPFTMPPNATTLEDTSIAVTIGGSLIQFQDEGIAQGTPTTVRNVNFTGGGVVALFAGDTVTVDIPGGAKGFVAITDIVPTASGNVGTKVKTDDNNVLQSCISSTNDVTVSVLAVTGPSGFKPTVTINGTAATLTRNATTDVWTGSAAITLSGASPHTVTATHGDGAIDTATVTVEALPVVTNLVFSGAYPVAGQTEHAAGQTLSLTVTADVPFTDVEVIDDSGSATVATSSTFAATTTKTLTVTVADRGSYGSGAPLVLPAKARVKNVNGTWGNVTLSNSFGGTNGVHVLALNNTLPVVTMGTITYPSGQLALKGSETATIAATYANVDTVNWTSPTSELSVASPTTQDNKTVTRIAGGYNISTPNLQAVATRTANATTATFSNVVWIANITPTISITVPAARLRSGGNNGTTAQNYTVTMTSDQRMQGTPSLTASVGTFQGSWVTGDNGINFTRALQIHDSDTKGNASFSNLTITNLAGIVVNSISSGASYTVGGFVFRTLTVSAWPNRETALGTQVADTSKLRVTNLSKGSSGSLNTSFVSSVGDAVDTYTITQPSGSYNATGNTLYNRDLPNAVSNTSGTAQFEVEEIV